MEQLNSTSTFLIFWIEYAIFYTISSQFSVQIYI